MVFFLGFPIACHTVVFTLSNQHIDVLPLALLDVIVLRAKHYGKVIAGVLQVKWMVTPYIRVEAWEEIKNENTMNVIFFTGSYVYIILPSTMYDFIFMVKKNHRQKRENVNPFRDEVYL